MLVDGLRGGHSGMEIDKGRANANVLLGRVLEMLREKMDAELVEIQGGVKENVIPKEAMAKILIPAEETAQFTPEGADIPKQRMLKLPGRTICVLEGMDHE